MADSGATGGQLIGEGDYVVLKREDVFKAVQVQRRKKVIFEKQWIYLDNAIGKHYGTVFEITGGGNLQTKSNVVASAEPKEAGADNRNIVDDGKSQKLTRDDIEALKEKGIKGQEIVQQLIENSATFRDKTEFAQEKYRNKKKKKYEASITILKPSTRILAIMYYAREPGKICQLRYDTLAQMLTLGNIHAGSKVIVMETCAGLVLGSVMERMGGYGSVVQMYPGGGPVRAATDCFGFPKSFYETLYEFPLIKLDALISGTGHYSCQVIPAEENAEKTDEESSRSDCEKQEASRDVVGDCIAEESEESMETSRPENEEGLKSCGNVSANHKGSQNLDKEQFAIEKKRKQDERRKRESEAAKLLQDRNADGLIIASRFHPTPLLLTLLEFLSPSRPFVVYCQYKEPLLECYTKLREKGGVINLKLSETWLRHYQVLPDRSHPKLVMSSGGGYILHGITVARDTTKANKSSPEGTEEPAPKKLKVAEDTS
ncbi:tRNA (adenine(58)-N(1))-methyltransferase non-catalytic subunit TRM6 [Bufo gargarizans]|uniref:tRNA (adenine(58)-N(1))-methyltransferase non-catalytic subunit TRM6 n=1 Tax=Bufo gargarizans TaxID=30331 RepID=UPI001CF56F0D|nr:tRNA (adenine(58)-N(1))-methyltransferase non-catalytic subunit TRM6 [Bufo gargarizans]